MSSLVGKNAPSFKAKTVINGGEIVNDFSLDQFVGKKHVIFFFYPKDFTFVCPTELHAFQEKLSEFESRGVAVVACVVCVVGSWVRWRCSSGPHASHAASMRGVARV